MVQCKMDYICETTCNYLQSRRIEYRMVLNWCVDECIDSLHKNILNSLASRIRGRSVLTNICTCKFKGMLRSHIYFNYIYLCVTQLVQNNTWVNLTVWRTNTLFLKIRFYSTVSVWSRDNQFYTQPVQVYIY